MENVLIVSCVADLPHSRIQMHILENYLSEVEAGVEKRRNELDAGRVIYLLPENLKVSGLSADIRFSSFSPTLKNTYAIAQALSGKLPQPMIQDGFVATFEERVVNVITPEEAYQLIHGEDTKFVSVTANGKTEVKEVKVGASIAEIADLKYAKAVLIGDLKGRFILPEDACNIKVENTEEFSSIVIYSPKECMVDSLKKLTAEAKEESCGKCVLCREGISQYSQIVAEMTTGKAKLSDLDMIKEVEEFIALGSYCPFGQSMPKPLLTGIELFRDEFEEHIKKKICQCGVCYKAEAVYIIDPDECTGCCDCLDECPEEAIEGKTGFIHMIDQDLCEQCGKCLAICEEQAIKAVTGKLPRLPKKLTKVGRW